MENATLFSTNCQVLTLKREKEREQLRMTSHNLPPPFITTRERNISTVCCSKHLGRSKLDGVT